MDKKEILTCSKVNIIKQNKNPFTKDFLSKEKSIKYIKCPIAKNLQPIRFSFYGQFYI